MLPPMRGDVSESALALLTLLRLPGVDTLAHQAALEEGAATVAILGNGLATVYPAANRGLARSILEAGGLLLAEVPPERRVEPRALVRRDRLQSGLAGVTVICQGGV